MVFAGFTLPEPINEIIFNVLTIIITGLATWLTSVIVNWLNTKIKNQKAADFLKTITEVVTNAVKSVWQSYVSALKGTEAWTAEAQKNALDKALQTAKASLTTDALRYIEKQHGPVDDYLTSLIESIIYDLKNKNK